MVKSRIRAAHAATAKREAPHRKVWRRITARRYGRKAIALAMAPIGAAALTLTGLVITAPGASASTECVNQSFNVLLDSNTYQPCVLDMQVLLNDLWSQHVPGPNQLIATDGYFGVHTGNDVVAFNLKWNSVPGEYGTMTPDSWFELCGIAYNHGFRGLYWQNAGCAAF